jgi:RNA polymerase-interacting CarD/CdnL/TRCF family regulator
MGSDDTDTEGGDHQGQSEMKVPSANATMGQPSKRAAASKRESNKTIITTPDGKKLRRKIKPRKKEGEKNAMIKYGSLFLLVAQMVGLVLLMRYSRTSAVESEDKQLYLASTAVFLMEVSLVRCNSLSAERLNRMTLFLTIVILLFLSFL